MRYRGIDPARTSHDAAFATRLIDSRQREYHQGDTEDPKTPKHNNAVSEVEIKFIF